MPKGPLQFPSAKLIEASDKVRAQKCQQEIDLILKAYDCVLMPVFNITGPQIQSTVLIQPLKRDLMVKN